MGRRYRRYTRNKRPVTLGDLEPKASYYRGFAQFHNQYAHAFGMLATQPTFELKRGDSLTVAAKYFSVSPYFCYPSF